MIFLGIDDTDTLTSPGTNHLAFHIVDSLGDAVHCHRIVRHQLWMNEAVPCTLKNGCASLVFEASLAIGPLIERVRQLMLDWFVVGSDPGLCVAEKVPPEVTAFGRRCQNELISQIEARDIAKQHALQLEGLGGTEDGVIGALAAIGLGAEGNDGRVVRWHDWPDDLCGVVNVADVTVREVAVRDLATGEEVRAGSVDVGKRLRPNLRDQRAILFVEKINDLWRAVRFL